LSLRSTQLSFIQSSQFWILSSYIEIVGWRSYVEEEFSIGSCVCNSCHGNLCWYIDLSLHQWNLIFVALLQIFFYIYGFWVFDLFFSLAKNSIQLLENGIWWYLFCLIVRTCLLWRDDVIVFWYDLIMPYISLVMYISLLLMFCRVWWIFTYLGVKKFDMCFFI